MLNHKSQPEPETVAQQEAGGDCVSRLVVPLPCPFCGDPMRINNAKLITHAVRPSHCIIADLVWDESMVGVWNVRHNVKGVARRRLS
jgi:hypothetical protein